MKKHSSGAKIIVGLITSVVILTIFFGFNGIFIFILSLICTAGMSLLFWIPVWLLVGSVVFYFIDIISKSFYKDEKTKVENENNPPGILAIKQYIIDAKKFGMQDQLIKETLVKKGWENENIERAYSLL